MEWITEKIAVGDQMDASDEEHLMSEGITHILNVIGNVDMEFKRLKYAKIPWYDKKSSDMLDEAINYIYEAVKEGKVLVFCGVCVDRSPTTVLAYLNRIGFGVLEAWQFIKNKHREASPHPEWIKMIRSGLP